MTDLPDHLRQTPQGCVEVLGGNQARTQGMVLAGLELLLVARPFGGHGGGDLYCLHSCGHRNFAKIVLLDISGHGDRSALIANDIHRLLHEHSPDTSPARLLDLVNRQFAHFAPPGILATSLCAVYDSHRSELRYGYGGQPPILLWQARSRQWTTLATSRESACGLPFGVSTTGCYEEQSISLRPGDILLMISDGVTETRGVAGTFLQPEGVFRLAQQCSEEFLPARVPLLALARGFLRRLEAFHGGPDFQDDLTLLWARCLPGVGSAAEPSTQF